MMYCIWSLTPCDSSSNEMHIYKMHGLQENRFHVNGPLLWDSDNDICPGPVMQTPEDTSAGSPHT